MSDFDVTSHFTLNIDHNGAKVELTVLDDRRVPEALARLTPKQAERLADEIINRRWEQYEVTISRDVTFRSSVGSQSVSVQGVNIHIWNMIEGQFADALEYHARCARRYSERGGAPSKRKTGARK
jgi:hypothetical protein